MAKRQVTKINYHPSYKFSGPDPDMLAVNGFVRKSGLAYIEIAGRANVSVNTLKRWDDLKTQRPQSARLEAVGRACGFMRKWVKMR